MPAIPYGRGAYRRDNGNLPELRLKNMFLESAVTGDEGVILISRPGMAVHSTPGTAHIRGIFSQENVFDGDVFTLSGSNLYRGTDLLGIVAGSGVVTFAAGASDELAVCAGEGIYRYDGSTLVKVTFPDSSNVTSILFHDGLYLAAKANSDTWYWSGVLDADSWGALDFSSAEARPDTLRDIKTIGDFVFLFGVETIERWANTGDADAPYSRVEGAMINKGVKATGCVAELDNALFFVGEDGVVYRMGDGLQRVSDHGIEERIINSTSVSAFSFEYEGHAFFCVRVDTGSFLYDASTNQWCEFATHERDNWRAQCACNDGTTVLFGDDEEGIVWEFSGYEDNSETLERLFTAAFPLDGGVAIVDRLSVEVNAGWTPDLTGQGSNPTVEMRASRDAGATFGDWRQASMGEQGKYRVRTFWTRCGMFDPPGAMFEIRVTDPVSFRVSGVHVNEKGGGRSR